MESNAIKYTIALKVKDCPNPNEEYQYSLNLSLHQENNPEKIFTSEILQSMRTSLQNQSQCLINDTHLNQMISKWIQDIKEGYRSCPITLDLPRLPSPIDQLEEAGNQEIPTPIYPDLSEIAPCWGMLPPLNFC